MKLLFFIVFTLIQGAMVNRAFSSIVAGEYFPQFIQYPFSAFHFIVPDLHAIVYIYIYYIYVACTSRPVLIFKFHFCSIGAGLSQEESIFARWR